MALLLSLCGLFWGAHKSLAPRARTVLGGLGQATLSFFAVATLLFVFFGECPKFCDLVKQRPKIVGGVSEDGKDDFLLFFFWRCVIFLVFYFSSVLFFFYSFFLLFYSIFPLSGGVAIARHHHIVDPLTSLWVELPRCLLDASRGGPWSAG